MSCSRRTSWPNKKPPSLWRTRASGPPWYHHHSPPADMPAGRPHTSRDNGRDPESGYCARCWRVVRRSALGCRGGRNRWRRLQPGRLLSVRDEPYRMSPSKPVTTEILAPVYHPGGARVNRRRDGIIRTTSRCVAMSSKGCVRMGVRHLSGGSRPRSLSQRARMPHLGARSLREVLVGCRRARDGLRPARYVLDGL